MLDHEDHFVLVRINDRNLVIHDEVATLPESARAF
jgi:hypothetical protein